MSWYTISKKDKVAEKAEKLRAQFGQEKLNEFKGYFLDLYKGRRPWEVEERFLSFTKEDFRRLYEILFNETEAFTKSSDELYLEALNSDNMREAELMVKEAAIAAGFQTTPSGGPWMHWTPKGGFNSFKIRSNDSARVHNGAFFTDSWGEIQMWQKSHGGDDSQIYRVYLGYSNPMIVHTLVRQGLPENEERQIRLAKRKGNDCVIWKSHDTTIAVFSSKQIKSAAPVTHDNRGNIVPLSRRFDSGNDIRGAVR